MKTIIARLAARPANGPLKLIAFLAVAVVFLGLALVFPTTPDEVSRITEARSWVSDAENSYFWPIGNIALVVITPFKSGEVDLAVLAVRLVNATITLALVSLAVWRTGSALALAVLVIVAPYLALVAGTAAQQGLMIGLITLLAVALREDRRALFVIAAALLILVNPATIVILPLGLIVVAGNPGMRPYILYALLGYVLTWPFIAFAWWDAGHFLPTISANGAGNLFLGNNPDPYAARGVGEIGDVEALYGLTGLDTSSAIAAYWQNDPGGFVTNILRKAWLYWMPWDYFRSNIGSAFYTLLFVYVGIAQVAIYGAVIGLRRQISVRPKLFAIGLAVAAWAVYTAFFVKFRFRIPFDFALLLALMLGYRPGIAQR